MPEHPEEKKNPNFLLGTITAATSKSFFYSAETIQKKLQIIQQKKPINYHEAILGSAAKGSPGQKLKVLYKGLFPWGFAYKTTQLTALGLMKPLQDRANGYLEDKPIAAVLATSLLIAGGQTPVLQGLSNMKTLHQAGNPPRFQLRASKNPLSSKSPTLQFLDNPNLIKDLNAFRKQYLFKNSVITFWRNLSFIIPFALTRTKTEDYFSDGHKNKLTFWGSMVSSTAAVAAGVVLSSPLDVLKTRKQLLPAGEAISTFQLATTMLKTEGPRAFYKGNRFNLAFELLTTSCFLWLQTLLVSKDLDFSPRFFVEIPKKQADNDDLDAQEFKSNMFINP